MPLTLSLDMQTREFLHVPVFHLRSGPARRRDSQRRRQKTRAAADRYVRSIGDLIGSDHKSHRPRLVDRQSIGCSIVG
jgi:hypothetical protein